MYQLGNSMLQTTPKFTGFKEQLFITFLEFLYWRGVG